MKKDKKRFLCIFTACLLIVTTCIPAFAQDSKQHIQYYEDGSYTIETLTIDNLSKSVSFICMPASVRAIFVQEIGKNRTFLSNKKR